MKTIVTACLLVGACATDLDSTEDQLSDLRGRGPALVQPGAGVTLLEVTDDHAIYQLGQQVFATALARGAEAELIGDVPAGNTAFVYRSGKVMFVWTNPDRTLPGFGVSPLVIWTARYGARPASPSSAIGTFVTASTADGERVLYTANSPADGTTGDLVVARADLSRPTTVAAGIPMAFPSGPCVPRGAFLGDELVLVSCAAGTTAATLAILHRDERREFSEPLFAPPRLRLDLERGRIATVLAAGQHPILVDRRFRTVASDDTAIALNAFIGGDGALIHTSLPAPGGLFRATRVKGDQAPRAVADFAGLNYRPFGSVGFSLPVTSGDGRFLSYFDATEPTFGLPTNVILRDVRGDGPPITLDSSPANFMFGPPFTSDSRHALYSRLDLVTLAVGPMFAANTEVNRQYSDDLGWTWATAFGSTITFNDRTTLDPINIALSTADLKSVDVSRKTLSPKLIAEQVNVTYFATHGGHGVAFVVDAGPTAGLYAAAVR